MPCRHYYKVLQEVCEATFTLGFIHGNWFIEEQGVTCTYTVHPSPARRPPILSIQGNQASVTFTHEYQRPAPMICNIDVLEGRDRELQPEEEAKLQQLSIKRKFGTLNGIAKETVSKVLRLGNSQDVKKFLSYCRKTCLEMEDKSKRGDEAVDAADCLGNLKNPIDNRRGASRSRPVDLVNGARGGGRRGRGTRGRGRGGRGRGRGGHAAAATENAAAPPQQPDQNQAGEQANPYTSGGPRRSTTATAAQQPHGAAQQPHSAATATPNPMAAGPSGYGARSATQPTAPGRTPGACNKWLALADDVFTEKEDMMLFQKYHQVGIRVVALGIVANKGCREQVWHFCLQIYTRDQLCGAHAKP